VIDIVHLHSCGSDLLEGEAVTSALERCAGDGKLRVVAYSGDAAPLRYAIASGAFGSIQASLNLCDQQNLRPLTEARACGLGTIAKRPLAGQPWRQREPSADAVHAEYGRRFATLQPEFGFATDDWEAVALRFVAYEPGVDCVVVGGTNPRHLESNLAAVLSGPLEPSQQAAIRGAFRRIGSDWVGLI
jgi:aryl-alcohol dehydrogenase-like predicted oxidoreductase